MDAYESSNTAHWVTRREAALALHVTPSTLDRYVRDGLLRAVKAHPSRRVYIDPSSITRLVAANTSLGSTR